MASVKTYLLQVNANRKVVVCLNFTIIRIYIAKKKKSPDDISILYLSMKRLLELIHVYQWKQVRRKK